LEILGIKAAEALESLFEKEIMNLRYEEFFIGSLKGLLEERAQCRAPRGVVEIGYRVSRFPEFFLVTLH